MKIKFPKKRETCLTPASLVFPHAEDVDLTERLGAHVAGRRARRFQTAGGVHGSRAGHGAVAQPPARQARTHLPDRLPVEAGHGTRRAPEASGAGVARVGGPALVAPAGNGKRTFNVVTDKKTNERGDGN